MSYRSNLRLDQPARRPLSSASPGVPARLAILGGGVAGLGVGWYARTQGLPFTLYEAAPQAGGLCVTYRRGDFLFDSGAHRFHDKDAGITRDVLDLLGASLRKVDRPSKIYDGGRLIRFPFRLTDVLRHLGPGAVARGALDLAAARMAGGSSAGGSFAGFAVRKYGRTLAERFLLNYSRKLWGLPCEDLSPRISGGRLKGLDLRQFLVHTLLGRGRDRRHAEGTFYYPVDGIGMLTDALSGACGRENIRTGERISRIHHAGGWIRAIESGGELRRVDGEDVVSTLPLDRFLAMLDPSPPPSVMDLARALKQRNLVLVTLFLSKGTVMDAATVYFPGPRFPFTRITEPRNRSERMSPSGHTSLVAEIPCDPGDRIWNTEDTDLVDLVLRPLEGIGWVRHGEVLGSAVVRLESAYTILSLDLERSLDGILRYLEGFANLKFAGRSGRFEYGWIHTMLRRGKDLIEELGAEGSGVPRERLRAPREAAP